MSTAGTPKGGAVIRVRYMPAPPYPILELDDGITALGYQPEAFLRGALQWSALIHPDDLAREYDALQHDVERAATEGGAITQYRFRAADGTWRELASIRCIERADNAAGCTVYAVLIEDPRVAEAIRRVRQHDRRLRDENERLAVIMGRTPTPIALLDHDGAVRWCNEAFARRTGYAAAALDGRPIVPLLAGPDTDAAGLQQLRDAAAAGRQHRAELVWRDAQGSAFWADTTYQAIPPDGSWPGGAVFTLRDVSDRRAAERALAEREAQVQQMQKMEAVGRLAAGVAHDFNNLLQVVAGAVEVLQAGLAADSPLHRHATLARTAAAKAADVTRQLLLVGRPGRGTAVLADARWLVREIHDVVRQALGPGVRLHETIARYPLFVRLDAAQFEQVLLNLAMNARDAVQGTGTAWLGLGREVLADAAAAARQVAPGAYVELTIRDDGPGMSGEVLRRAFEPFFTTKDSKGAGLGLATVYGIARHNGGYAVITSVPGRGTTVTVGFPEAVGDPDAPDEIASSEASPSSGDEPRPDGGERVLLVEDHPLVAQSIQTALADAGYCVEHVASADDALAALMTRESPDVLVTDVHLPGQSGRTLADAAHRLLPGLPVLYVTGGDDGSTRQPGTVVLRKPFTSTALVRAVRAAIAGG